MGSLTCGTKQKKINNYILYFIIYFKIFHLIFFIFYFNALIKSCPVSIEETRSLTAFCIVRFGTVLNLLLRITVLDVYTSAHTVYGVDVLFNYRLGVNNEIRIVICGL